MHPLMWIPVALLTMCGLAPASAAEAAPRLVGIKIVAPGIVDGSEELRAFNWHSTTTLAFYVPAPQGSIIKLEAGDSSIRSAVDDTGKNLLLESRENAFNRKAKVESFPEIATDGSGMIVELSLPQVPAAAATGIQLVAGLTVVTASQRENLQTAESDFSIGSTLEAGPLTLTVTERGKPDWGDAPLQITFKTSDAVDTIASIGILLPDGRSLDLSSSGSSSFSGLGMRSYTLSYTVPETFTTGQLVIQRWTDRQEQQVVIERTVTIGLDSGN